LAVEDAHVFCPDCKTRVKVGLVISEAHSSHLALWHVWTIDPHSSCWLGCYDRDATDDTDEDMSGIDTHHDRGDPRVEDGSDDDDNLSKNGDDSVDMYELEGHEGMLDNEHFVSTTEQGTQSSEDMDSPRISQNSSISHENMSDWCPTMPTSPSATTDHTAIPISITMMPPSDRMLDATSATNQFMVDAPMTWVGWKRRACDLHSILMVCTCGQAVLENEIEENEDVIKCKWAGCEMGWVSESCKHQLVSKLTNFISSIIYGASNVSTASSGGHARPAKQVGVVRDMQGRSGKSNDIILFPNVVISSHNGLVSSPLASLKKNPTQKCY
jgi:hypothetical protein